MRLIAKVSYVAMICRERQDLRVLNYHVWFSSMAVSWIDSALKKGREKIELAIEKDQVSVIKELMCM